MSCSIGRVGVRWRRPGKRPEKGHQLHAVVLTSAIVFGALATVTGFGRKRSHG